MIFCDLNASSIQIDIGPVLNEDGSQNGGDLDGQPYVLVFDGTAIDPDHATLSFLRNGYYRLSLDGTYTANAGSFQITLNADPLVMPTIDLKVESPVERPLLVCNLVAGMFQCDGTPFAWDSVAVMNGFPILTLGGLYHWYSGSVFVINSTVGETSSGDWWSSPTLCGEYAPHEGNENTTPKSVGPRASLALDDILDGLATAHGPGPWGSNLLVNGRTVAITVTTATPTPLAGVEIVLTSDAAGENVVTGTFVTDESGIATFKATPGSYYLWRRKASYTFGTNPRTLVVTAGAGTQSVTYADAAVQTGTIPAAADVRAGTPVGSSTGTLDLPTTDKVQYGVQYDAGSKTGTFASQGFIVYASPLNADGSVFTIIQGDAYDIAEARPLSWDDPGWWPDLTTATHVYLNIRDASDTLRLTDFGCTIVPAGGDAPQKVLAKPTHSQTHAMPAGTGYTFDLQAVFGDGGPVTLIEGTGSVILPVRRSS